MYQIKDLVAIWSHYFELRKCVYFFLQYSIGILRYPYIYTKEHWCEINNTILNILPRQKELI